jgi:hypothetical protein
MEMLIKIYILPGKTINTVIGDINESSYFFNIQKTVQEFIQMRMKKNPLQISH